MKDKEIIQKSIKNIKGIVGIIKSEISLIDYKISSKKEKRDDLIDEDMRTSVLRLQGSYLDFYKKIVEFLFNKLNEQTLEEDFFFYVIHLRTLIEIYARLLYCCFRSENEQMTYLIVETLKTIYKQKKNNEKAYIQNYNKYYQNFKPFLDKEKVEITSDPMEFSKNWLNNNGFHYPPVDKMLDIKLIKESSPLLSLYSKNENDDYLYGLLSDYVHGHILIKPYGNEKFWIISEITNLSCQISELVSIKILNNSKMSDIARWLRKTAPDNRKLLEVWK